ncbi:MAG TPA: GNAT family N-acetyltransferase [Bacteroidales bacterium]|nr:GNAT family N-acetyltransferase [Bacteroidales bacterium]
MKDNRMEDSMAFYELQWDTEYFGVSSAKAILYKPLDLIEWENLKKRFKDYEFISIENRNSEPINSQFIGKDTKAYLADVNIQFKKKLEDRYKMPENIEIYQALQPNAQIIEIADFQFSKFIEDPELAKRGGDQVYRQWINNSFKNPNKYFALSRDNNREINGFLLHSYQDNACTVELISVSKNEKHGGIGTSLFGAVEAEAYERGCIEIRVGTQVRNIEAINFYHKVGCRQTGCHQVYHLWK